MKQETQHKDAQQVRSSLWAWDKRSGRYRDLTTGRYLSKANLEKLQQRQLALLQQDIQSIGNLLLDGKISLKTWQEATAQTLKTAHLLQATLGKGGYEQLTQNDIQQVQRRLRSQFGYLKQFAIDLQRGHSISSTGQQVAMTEARFKSRLALYSKATRTSFEQSKQNNATNQRQYYMQRYIQSVHPCLSCPRYAAMGRVPVGALPLPGDACECGANCKCIVVYS